jgi:hypothetical protein
MDCRKFEALVVGARDRDRTPVESAGLAEHALQCAPCAALQERMARLEAALDGLSEVAAPPDFTAAVMARARSRRRTSPWYEGVLGALRPPAPVLALSRAAAVAALALMVASAGLLAWHHRGVPGAPPTVTLASSQGGPVIEMDSQFAEALVARHQSEAAMQPLSDDESMRLVSY